MQRVQVQEADRLKSEFLSNMSHELRTPLNSVMALSQLMLERASAENNQQDVEYLRVIERNGRNLLNLINDILDLSKIEAGRMEIYNEDLQPAAMIELALTSIRPLAEEKGLQLEVDKGDLPTVRSDGGKIQQILVNLISNAVKFTEEGTIHLSVSMHGNEMWYAVTDTGIGISAENQKGIFDEFRQADGTTTRRHEGTGLGLAICQKLAKLLGGEIAVESTIGEGSTFTFKLPTVAVAWPVQQSNQRVTEQTEPVLQANSAGTILVIDDDPASRELLRGYLMDSGFEAVVAQSGAEGIDLARKIMPLAITLDVMMPGLDGFTVLERLRSHPASHDVPVIILTAKDLSRTEQQDLERQVHRILFKASFDRTQLMQELSSVISKLNSAAVDDNSVVLVVEDNEVAALQIRTVVEELGYQVVVASGGAEAIRLVTETVPAAVILDLMMPEIDGFQVLQQIRSTAATVDLPVLVLTAKELTGEERSQLSNNNVQQLIQKGSLDRDQLATRVAELLNEPGKPAVKPSPPTPTKTRPLQQAGKGQILVVEDNPDNLFTITALLDALNHPYLTAADGLQAIQITRQAKPDLILMDIQLPGVSGVEATRTIKADPELSHIPIVALTARAMKGDREEILTQGFDDYLAKPIDAELLNQNH